MLYNKNTVSVGIFYTALSKYSNIIISLVVSAMLARLLTPEEFGVVAIVFVFVTFFYIISDFGVGPAIIQHKDLSKEDIRSIFSFTVISAIILALGFFLAAPTIAGFYNNPALLNVTKLFSLSVLFFTLNIVPNALLFKQLDFKKAGLFSTIVQIVTGVVAIVLARRGYSYYALIAKSICDSLLLFLIFYSLNPIKFIFKIKKTSLLKIANFSSYQFLFNFLNYFSRNSDDLLIGKYIGVSSLGYYDRAYRLMLLPVQNLTHVLTPVLLPTLSKYQDDTNEILCQYYRVVKILAIVGFPLSAFLYFSAPEIIEIVYGNAWKRSVPVFKLLSLTIGIQIVLSSTGSVFQAINKTKLLFISGLISSLFMGIGIAYGILVGSLESIAYGLIVAFILNFFLGFYTLIHFGLSSSFCSFLLLFLRPFLASVLTISALFLVNYLSFENLYIRVFMKVLVFLLTLGVSLLSIKEYRDYKF